MTLSCHKADGHTSICVVYEWVIAAYGFQLYVLTASSMAFVLFIYFFGSVAGEVKEVHVWLTK